jgi:hypothetical protein
MFNTTRAEFASESKLSIRTVDKMISAGQIKFIRIAGLGSAIRLESWNEYVARQNKDKANDVS